jgi:hypothetical protein
MPGQSVADLEAALAKQQYFSQLQQQVHACVHAHVCRLVVQEAALLLAQRQYEASQQQAAQQQAQVQQQAQQQQQQMLAMRNQFSEQQVACA